MASEAVRQLLTAWVAGLAQRSPRTAQTYKHCVARFLAYVEEGGLTNEGVARYLDSLAPLGPASRAHHISAVRSFLRTAQRQGLLALAPTDLLIRPRVPITSLARYLDLVELRRLLSAARELGPTHYLVCVMLALTGLRVSELAATQWRHVFQDPEGRTGLLVPYGKGGKERVIRIREDLFELLCEAHGSDKLDAKDKRPLIAGSTGRPLSVRSVQRYISDAGLSAGLDKPVSPHWLRHTYATLAARGGATAFTIQKGLGHSHLGASERYIHWAKGLEDSPVNHIPELT